MSQEKEVAFRLECTRFEVIEYASFGTGWGFDREYIDFRYNLFTSQLDEGMRFFFTIDVVGEAEEAEQRDGRDVDEKDSGEERLGTCTLVSDFVIRPFERLLNEEGEVRLPHDILMRILSAISDGMRGAIAAKSAGLALEHVVLPLLEPEDIARTFFEKYDGESAVEFADEKK